MKNTTNVVVTTFLKKGLGSTTNNSNIDMDNFFVLTGGPGTGKTSVIQALEKSGLTVVNEVARKIIQNEIKIRGDALPWANKTKYAEKMLDESIITYEQRRDSSMSEICFFDRGILDSLGYAKMEEIILNEKQIQKSLLYRYNPTVFIFPPWKSIYQLDFERKQNWQEALETYQEMLDVYSSHNYNLIEVPKTSIEDRLDFIVRFVKNTTN